MATCSGITRSGERCRGVAIDSTGLCYSHSPEHVDARRRSARKGGLRAGRGRPVVSLSNLKQRLEELAEDVLAGKVARGDAAVVSQVLNVYLRAVGIELKVKEQLELEERLTELETLLAQKERSA